MKYFNGFSLSNEEELFQEFLTEGMFVVAGFSYGAIKAFEYALSCGKRVDKLILISPAFFQVQDKRFKKLQMIGFRKDQKSYTENFLKNCSYPSEFDLTKYYKEGTAEELNELLEYVWEEEKIEKLLENGTKIEVHVGMEDKIVESEEVKNFFTKFAVVYSYKKKGHILQ